MTTNEALEIVNDRIEWCGNLYGSRWKEELELLLPCKEALENKIKYGEHTENPEYDSSELKLVCFSGKSVSGRYYDHYTTSGRFVSGNWFLELPEALDTLEIHKWRIVPEWKMDE